MRGSGIKYIFKKLGIFIETNTVPIILLALLLIIVSVQGAQYIEMASGTETFVEKNSKLYQDYDHLYLRIFSTQSIAVLIEGGNVKNPDVLKSMDIIEQQVLTIPGVVGTASAASVIMDANYQITGRRVIPDTEEEISSLVSSRANELGILMPDETHALLFVEMAGDSTDEELIEVLRETEIAVHLSDLPAAYSAIVTGDPAFMIAMQDEMNSSMAPLLMISVLLMIVVLYLVFRHVRWKILPLPIVLLGIIYTFGAMGYLKIPLSMVSMSAFPILIGLGIDYAIQFHNRIEEELEKGESEVRAVIETIKHTGPAVLIALTITALGFISLFTSSVPMVQDFGKLLLIGIIMCFLASLFAGVTVIYGLDMLLKKNNRNRNKSIPLNKPEVKSNNGSHKMELFFKTVATFTMKHPRLILGIAVFLSISGFYVDSLVPIQTDVKTFVPQDMPALINLMHLADLIGGSDALNLIIKTEDSADPEVLHWIDEFSTHEVAGRSRIYSTSSIVPIIKSMNGGEIPDNRNEIERIYQQIPQKQKDRYLHGKNMLLLDLGIGNAITDIGLEGVEELSGIVQDDIAWMPPPPGVDVTITGNSVTFTTVIGALTTGRIAMTMFGLVMVFAGLLVIYRDLIKALTPVVTMFMVIGWSGMIMYSMGLEYTPMTATLGALILGVGSEYAVLMMERYFEERDKGSTPEDAMRMASSKIGKAIFASGLTTIFGFSALMASPFSMNRNFGIVTVMDVALALLATFIVFPAVLVQLDNRRMKKKESRILGSRQIDLSGIKRSIVSRKFFSNITVILILFTFITTNISTVSAENELLIPNYAFSTNYYDSFGTPDIYASVLGDPEFERGETARIKINLVNKGVLSGFKYRTGVGKNEVLHAISLRELEYESMRTTAFGIEAQLISNSPYIEIEPESSIHTMESLIPGELPDEPLTFTITVSNKAPADVYNLKLPVSYEYQNQVRMINNNALNLGLSGPDHTVQYVSANKTLIIPIGIKASPKFEVEHVSGHLVAGKSRVINITYKNTGEIAAHDAIARIVVMKPLRVTQSVIRLGTMGPGDSKTVLFDIFADSGAVDKIYGLDSEIKYLEEDGDTAISDNLEVSIPLEVPGEKIGAGMLSFIGVIILLFYLILKTLRNKKKYG